MPESGRTLKSGYRLELFSEQHEISAEEVADVWVREAKLDPEEAQRRTSELVFVAISPAGELGGVSTAYLQPSRQLGCPMWFGRMFVAADHRLSGIMMGLAYATRDHVEEMFVSGTDRRAIGMLFEVEAPILKTGAVGPIARFGPLAKWPTDFTFIGENERADHVRVHYFAGALAPEPS